MQWYSPSFLSVSLPGRIIWPDCTLGVVVAVFGGGEQTEKKKKKRVHGKDSKITSAAGALPDCLHASGCMN